MNEYANIGAISIPEFDGRSLSIIWEFDPGRFESADNSLHIGGVRSVPASFKVADRRESQPGFVSELLARPAEHRASTSTLSSSDCGHAATAIGVCQ